MEINIRKAVEEDWKVIQKLNNEVFESDVKHDDDLNLDWPVSDTGTNFYKNLTNGKRGYCFIAEHNNIPVGYIALADKNISYRKSSYIEVENIGVSTQYRSQGIGKKLMEAATHLAKEKGTDRLFLSVYARNSKAISFYKDLGFEEIALDLEKKL